MLFGHSLQRISIRSSLAMACSSSIRSLSRKPSTSAFVSRYGDWTSLAGSTTRFFFSTTLAVAVRPSRRFRRLPDELLDPGVGGVELLQGLGLGLRDVGQALLGLHPSLQRLQRLQAGRAEPGVPLGRLDVLRQGGDVAVDLPGCLLAVGGDEGRVRRADGRDQTLGFLDEAVGAGGARGSRASASGPVPPGRPFRVRAG